eukprot:m.146220 g.146220  ORF g.146220 m.146220 type:complete len:178 (-) comp23095_c0_seq1:894-1427(-)
MTRRRSRRTLGDAPLHCAQLHCAVPWRFCHSSSRYSIFHPRFQHTTFSARKMGNSQGASVSALPMPSSADPREELAQCLARSGMALHGTTWCGWCTRQLDMFGPARSTVPYVDCTRADGARGFSDECKAKGITVVPSWSVPGIGIAQGTQPLETLARASGCGHISKNLEQFDKVLRK